MFGHANRRMIVLAIAACACLGSTAVMAAHAGARGRAISAPPTPSDHAHPTLPPGPPRKASERRAPQVLATNAHCGQVLTASLTLNGDLFCNGGDALTITGKGVVLNLAGHQIDGASTSEDGVRVEGNSNTVENGVISNFISSGVDVLGIDVPTTSDTVSAVRAVGNFIGFTDGGANSKITNCTATGNSYGFDAFGTGDTYSGDHELNNSQVGLYLQGTTTVVSSNIADGNGTIGIWDASSARATLTKNTADFNGNDGMSITGDPTAVDGGGNLAKGNDYIAGNPPEQCRGVVCG